MNSLPVSFWLKIFKYSNTFMCFAFNGFLAQCAKCSQTKYLHPHSMNWLFSVNLSNICKLGPHFVPIWSPFLLPNVPIWSPFHSKLGLHLVPIFKNLGPHSMWEQCPQGFYGRRYFTLVSSKLTLFTGWPGWSIISTIGQ